ncbi:MAG: hypothetical protein AAFR54_10470 [Planctomycetota bacterium]
MLAARLLALLGGASALAIAIPAEATALPQGSRIDWTVYYTLQLPFKARALLGGDAVVLYRTAVTSYSGYSGAVLERHDAEGEVLWSRTLPFIPEQATFDDRGRSVFLTPAGSSGARVRVHDENGLFAWERTLPLSSGTGLYLGSRAAAFDGSGAVTIAFYEFGATGPGAIAITTLRARALDVSTGADLWATDLGVASGYADISVDGTGGAMAVDLAGGVPVGPTLDLRYRRIDAAGNVAVETWNSVPWGGGDPVLRLQAVDPAGRQGLCSLAEDSSSGADVARIALDRDGSVRWTLPPEPLSTFPSDYAFLAGGDILYQDAVDTFTRIRPDGTVVDVPGAPHPLGATSRCFPLRDGGYLAVDRAWGTNLAVRYSADDVDQWSGTVPLGQALVFGGEGFDGRILMAGHVDFALETVNGQVHQIVEEESAPSTVACEQPVPNSTGRTGKLVGFGSDDLARNDLTLLFHDLPETVALLPVASQTTATLPNPGGSVGTLCLGGAIGRYPAVLVTTQYGTARAVLNLGGLPTPQGPAPALAGETWFFQGWHRDVDAGGPTSNLTDAIAVSF